MSSEDTLKSRIDSLELKRMSLGEGHPEIMLINNEILEMRSELWNLE